MSTKAKINLSGVIAKKSTTLAIAPAPAKVPESALALVVREAPKAKALPYIIRDRTPKSQLELSIQKLTPAKSKVVKNGKGNLQLSRKGQDVTPDWFQVLPTPVREFYQVLPTPARQYGKKVLKQRLGLERERMEVNAMLGGIDRYIGVPKGSTDTEVDLFLDNPERLRQLIAAGIVKVADEAGTKADDSVDWYQLETDQEEIAAQFELIKKGGKDLYVGVPKAISQRKGFELDEDEIFSYIAAGILKVVDVGTVAGGLEALDDSMDWLQVDPGTEEEQIARQQQEIARQQELLKKGGKDIYVGVPTKYFKDEDILDFSEEDILEYISDGTAKVIDVKRLTNGVDDLDDSMTWFQYEREDEDEIAAQQELFKKGGRNIYIGIPKSFLEGEGEELELDVDDVNQHILEGTVKVVDIGKLAGGLKALKAADDSIEWFQVDLLERTPTNTPRRLPLGPAPPTPKLRTGPVPVARPRINQMSYLMN
jgi:hypothetical protein